MPRKRTPDQPIQGSETDASTAVSEPVTAEHTPENTSFAERVGERANRIPSPDPFEIAGDYAAGVRLLESRRDRQVAIKFDNKPSQPVIEKLKESGYRWNPTEQIWAHPIRRETAMGTRIDAERLYQEVREMIRQEKGIEAAQEVPF